MATAAMSIPRGAECLTTSVSLTPASSTSSKQTGLPTSYQEAVHKLNMLDTITSRFQELQAEPSAEIRAKMMRQNLTGTATCLGRLGINITELDSLHAIHVAGTKGKGSTCAYIEAMLRSLGLKTGFYSSPHMVLVRERIRINGEPLSEEKFAEAVFSVHDRLEKNPSTELYDHPMPEYFKFLTVTAFEVLIREKVDVAIVEVGMGGELDATNVLRTPVCCGITTLDLDHVLVLGNTLPQIAFHKAGIFKPDTVAVVASDQTPESAAAIRKRAAEREVDSLSTAPQLSAYSFPGGGTPSFGIDGEHQKTNVALALQLARAWLRAERPQLERQLWTEEENTWFPGSAFAVPPAWAEAIARCHWEGRSQILERRGFRFFIDGAHTPKSMESCVEWFLAASSMCCAINKNCKMAEKRAMTLIFHCTGDRVPETLMESLKSLPLTRVLLCPPMESMPQSPLSDNYIAAPEPHIKQSMKCEAAWRSLHPYMDAGRVRRFDCVSDALEELQRGGQEEEDVLVTGSLILVGNVLSALRYK